MREGDREKVNCGEAAAGFHNVMQLVLCHLIAENP